MRVECSFDGSKIVFFFTSEGRVDFRELVRDLAGVFRARIELRQIGVRDEAKMLGGLGICGRPFCCAQFLDDFVPVSIKMAKTQNLSLNPTKISGTCGRLMCCLKYEQDAYEDALKRMPKNDSFVQTPDGPGNICDVNVLKETVHVRLDEKPEAPRCYHSCELCVLRNGKGSREGIEIPADSEIAARAAALCGRVEMIILTGGLAFEAGEGPSAGKEASRWAQGRRQAPPSPPQAWGQAPGEPSPAAEERRPQAVSEARGERGAPGGRPVPPPSPAPGRTPQKRRQR